MFARCIATHAYMTKKNCASRFLLQDSLGTYVRSCWMHRKYAETM